MRTITEIIIHCTAPPPRPDANCTVESIRHYHKSLGWHDIGYHYVIYPDGSVHTGRPVEEVGAHCTGHNAQSIGIAYVGGLNADGHPADTRTEAQCLALLQLVYDLMEDHPSLPSTVTTSLPTVLTPASTSSNGEGRTIFNR